MGDNAVLSLPLLHPDMMDKVETELIDMGQKLSMDKEAPVEMNVMGNCIKEFAPAFVRAYYYTQVRCKEPDKPPLCYLATALTDSLCILLGLVLQTGVRPEGMAEVVESIVENVKTRLTQITTTHFVRMSEAEAKKLSPEDMLALLQPPKDKTLH